MSSRFYLTRSIFGVIAVIICYCIFIGGGLLPNTRLRQPDSYPRKIWQKWEIPAQGLKDELQRLSLSWPTLNPSFRYELLTTESSLTFVEEHFAHRPDIVRLYRGVGDGVMRADLIRYLVLLAAGGVYSDIDTDCSKPIRQWIPEEYQSKSTLVVGIEYDAQGGEIRHDFSMPTQLCQWTFWSKAGSKALLNVVNRVFEKLAEIEKDPNIELSKLHASDIMEITGPHIFTKAIMESARISFDDISNLTAPRLFGDVLVLPISAFASGQDHSGSKDWGNDEQLMSHHFLGFSGWKQSHQ